MAERKIYQGGLVRPVGIPSVSFAQFQEAAQAAGGMESKLDSIVRFATKEEEKVQINEAKTYAASNPISVDDYINASPTEREALVGKDKYTSYGQTVRATQLTFLSTDMSIRAQKDFMSLKIEANTSKMPLDEYENKLNAIVQGYSDAVLDVDPTAAITVKADLATKASGLYSSYSDGIVKDYKNLIDSTTIVYGDELVDTIPDEMSKGHIVTIIGQDNQPTQISIDDHINLLKNKYRLQLLSKGMKKEDFVKWEAKWDAKVIQHKKNIIFGEFVDKPENLLSATKSTKIWKEVSNGNFEGNQKLQALYNSLDEKEQAEFRTTVREWKNNRIKSFEDDEKAFGIDVKTKTDEIEIKYLQAVRGRDFVTANALVDEAKGVDDKLYKKLLIDITADIADGDFLDPKVLSSLDDNLYSGTLSLSEIDSAYDNNQINLDQKRNLKEKLLTKKNESYRSAEKYMRNAFGFPEAGMITLDRDTKIAFEQYRNKSNELMDYMRVNPKATANEIMQEAKRLTGEVNNERDMKNEIKNIKNTITNEKGEFGLRSRAWTNYFKNFYSPDYKNIGDTFINTPGGIDALITELEELKELTPGQKYKVDQETMQTSEGGFFADEFKRPMGITNPQIDKLIEELNALRKLYE
jgi:hypothetical protein